MGLVAINTPSIQTKIIQVILVKLNNDFGTTLSVESIKIIFPRDVQLHNVKAIDDRKNTLISIPNAKGQIDLLHLILNPKNVKIKKLTLNRPEIFVTTYLGDSTSNMDRFIKKFSDKENSGPSKTVFESDIQIKKAHLKIIDQNLGKKNNLILIINQLTAIIKNFRVKNRTVEVNLLSLKSTGKLKNKDFNIHQLSSKFIFTPKQLQSRNLNLQTSRSKINGHITLYYNKSEDLSKFINKVAIRAEVKKGSQLSFKDLKLFLDDWDSNAIVSLQGKIHGILNRRLTLSNLYMESGKNRIKTQEIILSNITDRKKFKIVQKNHGIIENSYTSITRLLPSFINRKIPVFLKDYGDMRYYGPLTITPKFIKAKGFFSSNTIGTVHGDIQLNNYTEKIPKYKGAISTDNVNLSVLTKNKNLESVGGEFRFDGEGFSLNALQIQLIGRLNQLTVYDRKINKIEIDGRMVKKYFEGKFSIDDPQLNMNFDGKLNFSQKEWFSEAKAKIKLIDLKALGLSEKKKALLSSNLDINIQRNNIEHLQGTVYLTDMTYETSEKKFKFPKVSIESKTLSEKDREITLSAPDMIQGSFRGNFKWLELSKLVENNVNHILNEKKKHTISPDQSLTFDLNLTHHFIEPFAQNIKILSDSRLQGLLTSDNLIFSMNVEKVQIKNNTLDNASLHINTSSEKKMAFKIDRAIFQGISFKNIDLSTKQKNNLLLIKTKFLTTLSGAEQEADLNFYKYGNWNSKENNLTIGLRRSHIKINGYKWWINVQNKLNTNLAKIDLKNKKYIINHLTFHSEEQKLTLSAEIIGKHYKITQGTFDKIQLKQLIPVKAGDLTINGVAQGKFFIENSGKDLKPEINLEINQLLINDVILGNLKINTIYNNKNKRYQLNSVLKNEQTDILTISGNIGTPPQKKAQLDFDIKAKNIPVNFLQAFLGNIFSNIRGNAEGYIKFTGDVDNPTYQGKLHLKKVGTRVNYLNTDYELIGEPSLLISPKTFILKDFTFKDTQYNTKGYISGAILNEDFTKWILVVSIDSKNLLALNTTSSHNNLFYGTVFAGGKIELLGDTDNLALSIREGKISGFSQLFINTKGCQSIAQNEGFIRFINFNAKDNPETANSFSKEKKKENKKKGLSISIETDITEKAEVKLIMDSSSDNFIQARGTGNISFKIQPGGNIEITGKYNTTEGLYLFSNEQIPFLKLDKQFQVKPGGTITWTGSATNANLNLSAFYPKSASNVGEYINLPNSSSPPQSIITELKIDISGQLSQPELEFDIDFPNASENIKQQLAQKLNTQDEKLTQFGSILLLGKFFVDTKNIGTGLWSSSAYDVALKQLGNILSSINNALDINFEYIEGNRNTDASSSFKSSIFYNINRRFSIKGVLGVPFNTVNKQRSFFSGEVQLDMDISKQANNSLKLTLFSRPNTFGRENDEFATFSSQTYGGGLIYTSSFHKLKNFWSVLFKNKKTDNKNNPKKIINDNK
ncbi:MAG: hypothetical protein ACMUEL_03440 [Flavobacteriales bacterium Tduv]